MNGYFPECITRSSLDARGLGLQNIFDPQTEDRLGAEIGGIRPSHARSGHALDSNLAADGLDSTLSASLSGSALHRRTMARPSARNCAPAQATSSASRGASSRVLTLGSPNTGAESHAISLCGWLGIRMAEWANSRPIEHFWQNPGVLL